MSLRNCKLYIIIDKRTLKNRDIVRVAGESAEGGADIIQFRDKEASDGEFLKEASRIRTSLKGGKVFFVINDRPDIASLVGADGLHLGQCDLPLERARRIFKKGFIGISTHSPEEAYRAENEGADYIAIGPVFGSKTKRGLEPIGLEKAKEVFRKSRIPCFAIGGITEERIKILKDAGIPKVACVHAAIGNKKVFNSVKGLRKAIGS